MLLGKLLAGGLSLDRVRFSAEFFLLLFKDLKHKV